MSQDRELEQYMQGKSDLSKAYAELPPIDVPDHLDAAILAEAHRAVGARPGARPKRRWAVPLSLVATLFVVVMIGLQWPYVSRDAALPAPGEERPTVVAAAPAPITMQANKRAETARVAQADKADVAVSQGAPAVSAAAKPAPVVENKPMSVMSAAPAAPAAAEPRVKMLERAADDREMALTKGKKSAAPAAGSVGEAYSQPAPAAAGLVAPAPAARPMAAPLRDEAAAARQRPEDWIARITLLKQQGKLDEARKELAEFRKRYPDYVVPEAAEIR
ncbi:MAG TPA: hypothetical protein VIU93_00405 [Gallionellaceae bacterium]